MRRGATFLELVVTVAILMFVAGLGTVVSVNGYRSESFSSEHYNLVNILRRARSEAQSNLNQSDHGIYFDAADYLLFEGPSYASRTPDYDLRFPTTGGITVTGAAQVVFRALDGSANTSATIIMQSGEQSKSIHVNNEGRIEW